MSSSKIPRGEFRNPCPDLKNPAAKNAVDSLLATVTEAYKRFGDPTEDDYAIAQQPLDELQQQLIYNEISVKEIVEARIRLTIKASLTTHCLTAFPYEKALEAAAFHDQDYDNDEPEQLIDCYPLLGLVFSVKDCIHVEGFPTTLGCSSRAAQNETTTASLVQKMIDAGAIMIAKTTAPQLMMSNTTQSPLWGTTRSPLQSPDDADSEAQEFQVGGSSGGEAALVRMGGSQIGVGTDMGGSVRQPACLNELFGYKFGSSPRPANFTWSLPNDFMTGLPHTSIPATAPGLLARDISTLRLAAEALHGAKYENVKELSEDDYVDVDEGDPSPEPEDLGNNPRIVYTTQQSSPEVQHLIRSLVQLLRKGDELARPTKCDELADLDLKAWGAAWTEYAKEHGFDDARAMLGDDPLIKRTLFDETRLSIDGTEKDEWKPQHEKLQALKDGLYSSAGIEAKDNENVVFITPTYVLGGPVQNQSFVQLDDAGESEIWCQIFNLLDWPAINIPITDLPETTRQQLRNKAVVSSEWAQYLPGAVETDPFDEDAGEQRLPYLSVQLATTPDNALALLDYAERISKAHKSKLAIAPDTDEAEPDSKRQRRG